MTQTDLDRAHAAMEAAADDDTARLAFYDRLADSELALLLTREPDGDRIDPETVDIDGVTYVLAFDREDRLATFTGRAAPYASVPGRALMQMLAGQGIGLALNPEVAPSAILIPSEAVDWLAEALLNRPEEAEARLTEILPPKGLPQGLLDALSRKLGRTAGLAKTAWLAAARYEGGGHGHVLAFVDAAPNAETALAHAAGEALTFSGIEAGVIDVLFVAEGDSLTARLARVGLRLDLPDPAQPAAPPPPGSDPARPPKLR